MKKQYTIFVCQETYGHITVEAEDKKEVASIMNALSIAKESHPLYKQIDWTPQEDDLRVVDTFLEGGYNDTFYVEPESEKAHSLFRTNFNMDEEE